MEKMNKMHQKRQKVYISGPVSGRKFAQVYQDFGKVVDKLHSLNFDVVNPLDNNVPFLAPHSAHMKADIENECKCDRIYYMRHWRKWVSLGVWQERFVAWAIGLPRLREKEIENMERELTEMKNSGQ